MKKRTFLLLLSLMAIGCQAMPRLDMGAAADRASGVTGSIVIRGSSGPVEAMEPVRAGGRLSSSAALRLALLRDPRIAAALARVRAAEADAKQARLLPNPILNIDVRFPEGGGRHIFEATLTDDLVAVLRKPGEVRAADSRLRSAAAQALATVLDTIVEVREAYASAQSIDAQMQTLDERSRIVDRLLQLAQHRLTAGEGTRLDVLTLRAQQVQMAVEVSERRMDRTEQRLKLARLIGLPRDAADWSLEPWQAPPIVGASESAWVDVALVRRPEIDARAWELAALGEDVKLAGWGLLDGSEAGAHGEHDVSWMVGPTVTTPVPLFDFGQQRRDKARAERDAAMHELAQARLEVIEEVRRSYAAYAQSRAALALAQDELLPLQLQQRQQAELAYRNGEVDLTTLLAAENSLAETRSTLVELEGKVTAAMIRLERSAGGAGAAASLEAAAPTRPAATQSSEDPGGRS